MKHSKPLLYIAETVSRTLDNGVQGVYLLGCAKQNGAAFDIQYFGRSDVCLKTRLLRHEKRNVTYYFKAIVCESAKAAFILEAYLWHCISRNGKLMNKIHPASPFGTKYRCPYCDFSKTMKERIRFLISDRRKGRTK